MKKTKKLLETKTANIATGILLAVMWTGFTITHVERYKKTEESVLLFLIAAELITIIFYIIRHDPKSVSTHKIDWVVAFVGTFITLFLSPSETGLFPLAKNLMFIGIILQIMGLISLNRSFALVAAQRKIKTENMYTYVRHPIYASYLVTFTIYVIAYTTVYNLTIYFIFLSCMLMRISREERHLCLDTSYRNYMTKVRYRLIPGVF